MFLKIVITLHIHLLCICIGMSVLWVWSSETKSLVFIFHFVGLEDWRQILRFGSRCFPPKQICPVCGCNFVCMCVYVHSVYVKYPQKPEEGIRCSGTGVIDNVNHHVSAGTQTQVLLTTKLSLKPLPLFIYFFICACSHLGTAHLYQRHIFHTGPLYPHVGLLWNPHCQR